jgi:hypothetical protein
VQPLLHEDGTLEAQPSGVGRCARDEVDGLLPVERAVEAAQPAGEGILGGQVQQMGETEVVEARGAARLRVTGGLPQVAVAGGSLDARDRSRGVAAAVRVHEQFAEPHAAEVGQGRSGVGHGSPLRRPAT